MRPTRLAYLILFVLLSSAFDCPKAPKPCDCPREEFSKLTKAQIEELLEDSIAAGVVGEDSRDANKIRRLLRKDKGASDYFGDEHRDLGYPPEAIWTKPAELSEDCPFMIYWRNCYNVANCRTAVPDSTGPYREIITIEFDADAGEAEIEPWVGEFTRESMVQGDCRVDSLRHGGLRQAGNWSITIEWEDIDPLSSVIDCQGSKKEDVTANDEAADQWIVGCFCTNHTSHHARFNRSPGVNHETREVVWSIQYEWDDCDGNPPETREFSERITITRVSDGELLVDETREFPLTMGSSLERDMSVASLEDGVDYEFRVVFSGDECACDEDDLGANNAGTVNVRL